MKCCTITGAQEEVIKKTKNKQKLMSGSLFWLKPRTAQCFLTGCCLVSHIVQKEMLQSCYKCPFIIILNNIEIKGLWWWSTEKDMLLWLSFLKCIYLYISLYIYILIQQKSIQGEEENLAWWTRRVGDRGASRLAEDSVSSTARFPQCSD